MAETSRGWRLLLQIGDYPHVTGGRFGLSWNFGAGTGYVFISPGCTPGDRTLGVLMHSV